MGSFTWPVIYSRNDLGLEMRETCIWYKVHFAKSVINVRSKWDNFRSLDHFPKQIIKDSFTFLKCLHTLYFIHILTQNNFNIGYHSKCFFGIRIITSINIFYYISCYISLSRALTFKDYTCRCSTPTHIVYLFLYSIFTHNWSCTFYLIGLNWHVQWYSAWF